jgi:hypothetical protein
MSREYHVLEVVYLPTGETRLIKADRFHPDIHKKTGREFNREYALAYGQPVHTQTTDLGVALAFFDKNKEEKKVAIVEEKKDNKNIEAKSFDKMSFAEIRKVATEKGVAYVPTDKKSDLLAKIKDANSTNL